MIKISLMLLISNFFLLINFKKFSSLIKIYDRPDNILKKHKSNVPLLGGIILVINLLIYLFFLSFFEISFENLELSNREIFSAIFLVSSFFFLGLYDDKFKLSPNKKFLLSIIISLTVIYVNDNLLIQRINFSFIDRNMFFENFSYFFTLFCIVILINSLNFYDGINGQSLIFFITIFCYLSISSPLQEFYLILILICAFILFLNLQNKIFLGDSGIYTLGSILVFLLIYEHNIFETIRFADEIFLLLILPGIDLLRVSIIRIINGKNAFYGDRNHIHHILINKFSLLLTNIILFLLFIFPITIFSFFKINFFVIFSIFLFIYIFLIQFFNSNGQKYYNRKK